MVSFGAVAAHGDGDAAEELNALGDGVDDLYLLVEVLIEEEVELVEGGAGYLPVVLLVHVAEDDGVGQKLVELLAHLRTNFGVQRVRKVLYYVAVFLDLFGVLLVVLGDEIFFGMVAVLACYCHDSPLSPVGCQAGRERFVNLRSTWRGESAATKKAGSRSCPPWKG